jgi:hypothetical protein
MKMLAILIIFLGCFVNIAANASDLKFEKLAAFEANCSKEQPCIISVTKEEEKYVVKVNRSTSITPEGVLKFRAGSVVYYIYNLDGMLEETKPTT